MFDSIKQLIAMAGHLSEVISAVITVMIFVDAYKRPRL